MKSHGFFLILGLGIAIGSLGLVFTVATFEPAQAAEPKAAVDAREGVPCYMAGFGEYYFARGGDLQKSLERVHEVVKVKTERRIDSFTGAPIPVVEGGNTVGYYFPVKFEYKYQTPADLASPARDR